MDELLNNSADTVTKSDSSEYDILSDHYFLDQMDTMENAFNYDNVDTNANTMNINNHDIFDTAALNANNEVFDDGLFLRPLENASTPTPPTGSTSGPSDDTKE